VQNHAVLRRLREHAQPPTTAINNGSDPQTGKVS
jgi:hypothetical protein